MAKVTYPGIPNDVLIDIQVSGTFYNQIVRNLLMVGEIMPREDFQKALEGMKEDRPSKDHFEITIRTLTALVFEIEQKAKAQDKMKNTEIEIDDTTGDLISAVDVK